MPCSIPFFLVRYAPNNHLLGGLAADRAGRARGVRFAARSLADLADTEMVAAAFLCRKGEFMSREPFEAMPDVMDAKQIAEALQISKAGHTTF